MCIITNCNAVAYAQARATQDSTTVHAADTARGLLSQQQQQQ
jgi:hypothetical protein